MWYSISIRQTFQHGPFLILEIQNSNSDSNNIHILTILHQKQVLKNVHEIYTIWETKNESEVSLVSKSEQKEKKEQEKRILVKRERHVRQLFIKGDTIVLVTKADSQDKFKT